MTYKAASAAEVSWNRITVNVRVCLVLANLAHGE